MVDRDGFDEHLNLDEVDKLSLTSYAPYPSDKPFINSQFVNHKKTTSKAIPFSNRDVIIDALKKMQIKLKDIEFQNNKNNLYTAYPFRHNMVDQIDKNSDSLSADENKENLKEKKTSQESSCSLISHLKNIEQINEKTDSTEKRVIELEKQLDKMRKILNRVNECQIENDSDDNTRRKNRKEDYECLSKKNKPKMLEKSNLIVRPKASSVEPKRTIRPMSLQNSREEKQKQHYKLNIGEIPFINGKSAEPSHNLGVNIQNVISLLKLHNPRNFSSQNALNIIEVSNRNGQSKNRSRSANCRNVNLTFEKIILSNDSYHNYDTNGNEKDCLFMQSKNEIDLSNPSPRESINSNEQIDYYELLSILQEEYTKLVLKQYNLAKQVMNLSNFELKDELDREAELIKKKIDIKARQIRKIKKHQKSQKKKKSFFIENHENLNTNLGNKQTNDLTKLDPRFNSSKTYSNKSSFINTSISKETVDSHNHLRALKLLKEIKNLKTLIKN